MNKKPFLVMALVCLPLLVSCYNPPEPKEDKQLIKKLPEQPPTTNSEAFTSREAFTSKNKKIEDGLTYQILKPGNGTKTPQKGDSVTVHYAGWLEENGEIGKKFDSSVDRGQKFTFTIGIGQVIKGWDKGIMGMKIGEKRRLIIQHLFAYGIRGIPGVIPPKATLIFEVELFAISRGRSSD